VQSNVQVWLRSWFAGRAPGMRLDDDDNFFEREAVDSFGVIELIEGAEQHFGMRFTERDFQDRRFSTISGLSEIIASRMTDGR
jgi:acyl carrier protein